MASGVVAGLKGKPPKINREYIAESSTHLLLLLQMTLTIRGGHTMVCGKRTRTSQLTCHLRKTKGPSQPQLSLSEEARNTGRHRSWNPDLKLRNSGVAFISAGTSKAEELTQIPQERTSKHSATLEDENVGGIGNNTESHLNVQDINDEVPLSSMSLGEAHRGDIRTNDCTPQEVCESTKKNNQDEPASNVICFTDIKGLSMPVHTGLSPPRLRRSPSPIASDSSEEVILFTGRNMSEIQTHTNNRVAEGPDNAPDSVSRGLVKGAGRSRRHMPRIVNDLADPTVTDDPPAKQSSIHDKPPTIGSGTTDTDVKPGESQNPAESRKAPLKCKKHRRGKRSRKTLEETEIMEDYILNALDGEGFGHALESSRLNGRDLGGSDADQWVDDEEPSAAKPRVDIFDYSEEDWDSADLRDFDEFSTSSEAPDAIKHILSKRQRPSGVQYLVVEQGFTIDDAQWLPVRLLERLGLNIRAIERFEEKQTEIERLGGNDGDSENSLQLAMGRQEDLDDLEDHRDLEDRRRERMSDEQIARLLAKQEELGLGSDDLVLFNGDDLAKVGIEDVQLDGSWGRPIPLRSEPKPKRKKAYQSSFPSVTAFVNVLDQDPYNGFDVMDHERPSLRKKPKGRRGQLPLELSDSDLEQTIHAAWENDRTKKKIRKQEREELRAQGLLAKNGKVDMKAKYRGGMTIDQVRAEIRDFLLSSTERYVPPNQLFSVVSNLFSLSLPPMAQKERKVIHEIANVFKLKSKSIGSGTSRYPVLYRTARTLKYDEGSLSIIDITLSSKRFFPRLDRATKRGVPVNKPRGFAGAAVSYRDGEIVGAAAPEIGQDNKGRAMLEKMGWSTGTVLGAVNNTRGIVQPVTQIVKTGKAGLG